MNLIFIHEEALRLSIESYTPADIADIVEMAVIARETAVNLLDRLNVVALKPRYVLDMGCGMGFCSALLKERYPSARVLSVDLREDLLKYIKNTVKDVNEICSDGYHLPIASQSVDLIVTNLFIPWMCDLKTLFKEWRRVLRPDGLFVFTSLGPDTLMELREHISLIPQMTDMHNLGDDMLKAGFMDPVLDVEHVTLRYREKKQLLRELYVTQMLPFIAHYEEELPLSLTYEIIYGHAWGPAALSTMDEQGVITVPLSNIII
jgi:malonyl-CoA O-methyltransferase